MVSTTVTGAIYRGTSRFSSPPRAVRRPPGVAVDGSPLGRGPALTARRAAVRAVAARRLGRADVVDPPNLGIGGPPVPLRLANGRGDRRLTDAEFVLEPGQLVLQLLPALLPVAVQPAVVREVLLLRGTVPESGEEHERCREQHDQRDEHGEERRKAAGDASGHRQDGAGGGGPRGAARIASEEPQRRHRPPLGSRGERSVLTGERRA